MGWFKKKKPGVEINLADVKIITAKEAYDISIVKREEKNKAEENYLLNVAFPGLMHSIQQAANSGMSEYQMIYGCTLVIKNKLLELGYTVSDILSKKDGDSENAMVIQSDGLISWKPKPKQ